MFLHFKWVSGRQQRAELCVLIHSDNRLSFDWCIWVTEIQTDCWCSWISLHHACQSFLSAVLVLCSCFCHLPFSPFCCFNGAFHMIPFSLPFWHIGYTFFFPNFLKWLPKSLPYTPGVNPNPRCNNIMLLYWWCESVRELVAQLCLPLCHPMDCSLPGASVHGILQGRTLEWVAIPFSRGSS